MMEPNFLQHGLMQYHKIGDKMEFYDRKHVLLGNNLQQSKIDLATS